MSGLFQTRPDGEYRLCQSCRRAGYGVDAWHPATVEFWPTLFGAVQFYKCKACRSEVMAKKFGFVPEREAA